MSISGAADATSILDPFRGCLSYLQKQGLLTDICLLCDGGYMVRAHKVVLCASSDYFFNIFTKEKENEVIDAIGLQGVGFASLKAIIDFMYTGILDISDNYLDKFTDIVFLLKKFKMELDNSVLQSKFKVLLTPNSFVKLCSLATCNDLPQYQQIMNEYAMENKQVIFNDPEVLNHDLHEVYPVFIRCSQIGFSSNELKHFIASWLKHKNIQSCPVLEKLLLGTTSKKVVEVSPFHSSSVTCLQNCDKHENKSMNDKTFSMLSTMKPWKSEKCITSAVSQLSALNELDIPNSTLTSLVVITIGCDRNVPTLFYFNTENDLWSSPETLQVTIPQTASIAYCNDWLFIVGGHDHNCSASDAVIAFNRETKKTKKLPCLHTKRRCAKVLINNNILYAIGGIGPNGESLTTAEMINIEDRNGWKIMQKMNVMHNVNANAIATNNGVYMVGGGTKVCEYYSVKTRKWENLPSLPEVLKEFRLFVVIIGNQIIVFKNHNPNTLYTLVCGETTWKLTTAVGEYPDNIVDVANDQVCIFIITLTGLIYKLEIVKSAWVVINKLPESPRKILCFQKEVLV